MAVFSLFRGTDAQVAAREKHEGQMLLATDTEKLSFDVSNSQRITIVGNNEIVLTDTLAAGDTTLSFTNAAISNDARLDVETSVYGVSPTNMTQSGTTATLTFAPQSSALSVHLVIRR